MRFKTVLAIAAAIVAVSVIAYAQAAKQPSPKATFQSMQTNVEQITNAAEKERWEANVAMWKVRLDHSGKLEPDEIAKMEPLFDTMKVNMVAIKDGNERDRWVLNRDLWQMALVPLSKIAKADLDKMYSLLNHMKANIAKIGSGAEKARWQANHDLWRMWLAQD